MSLCRPTLNQTAGLALALALSLAATAALAQDETEGSDATAQFVESVEVQIVNVDVWVTDRDGKPVTGLTQDDFVVRRDGEPVPITNFYAVDGGRAVAAPETAETEAQPPSSTPPLERRAPRPTLPPEHRLWLVAYIDNANIEPNHRRRVLPDLRTFLSRSQRDGHRVMVVSYDRSLEVRQPFTDDPTLIEQALDEIAGESGFAVVRLREQMQTVERIVDAHSEDEALAAARLYAETQLNEVQFTTRALEEMIDSLAGLPGRKVLLYVTSGVPMRAGEEMFQAVATKFDSSRAYAEIPRHDASRDFERIGRQATANRVAFITMDAHGFRPMRFGSAEYRGFITPGLRSTLESAEQATMQASLHLLAQETGGHAIVNRNETLPALEEAAVDFDTFYSLGISNPDATEGRFHRLKIEVKHGGVRVRHRQGYRTRGPDNRMIDLVRSSLLYRHEDNPLGLSVELGRPQRGEGGTYTVPIRLRIPLANVALVPVRDDRYEMRLKLYVGAVDERGDLSDIEVVPIGLRLAAEHVAAAKNESFLYTHGLLMKGGQQMIGLAIRDVYGGLASNLSQVVTIDG
jgi:VWFA-related protein